MNVYFKSIVLGIVVLLLLSVQSSYAIVSISTTVSKETFIGKLKNINNDRPPLTGNNGISGTDCSITFDIGPENEMVIVDFEKGYSFRSVEVPLFDLSKMVLWQRTRSVDIRIDEVNNNSRSKGTTKVKLIFNSKTLIQQAILYKGSKVVSSCEISD